jgi:hypothetical protein
MPPSLARKDACRYGSGPPRARAFRGVLPMNRKCKSLKMDGATARGLEPSNNAVASWTAAALRRFGNLEERQRAGAVQDAAASMKAHFGSWAVSRSVRNKGLSMNRNAGLRPGRLTLAKDHCRAGGRRSHQGSGAGSRSGRNKGLSLNRRFGVPRLRGPDRLTRCDSAPARREAELRTVSRTAPCPECAAEVGSSPSIVGGEVCEALAAKLRS